MVTKEEARKYLIDVAPEHCFLVNNGPILKNLDELANSVQQLSGETYRHHVNREKNDFSRWINDAIGDSRLANDLLSSRSRESASKKIKNRLNSLKKAAG